MEFLLVASAVSFIAACVGVLVLEPRVESGERPLACTKPGLGVASASRP